MTQTNKTIEAVLILLIFLGSFLALHFSYQLQVTADRTALRDDVLTVRGVVTVTYTQSTLWFEEAYKKYGDDYYTVTDDQAWYSNSTWDYLEEKGIPIIGHMDKRYLDFVKDNGQHVLIDIESDPYDSAIGFIIFDGKQDPLKIDIVLPEYDVNPYFNLPPEPDESVTYPD